MSRVLLTGATGLVGSHLLRLLIAEPRVSEIIAPTRRALPPMDKVTNLVEEDLTDVLRPLEGALDVVFCCLGTTRKQAGSKEAFIHVDYTLVVDSALAGQRLGARHMLVVSANGANARSPFFYNRVKGEMENALRHQAWPRLTLLRPSLLLGDRPHKRGGESLFAPLFKILPGNLRAVEARDVAQVMLREAFTEGGSSVNIIESRDLHLA
ncbi:NAD(P)H-binding protein [Erwiniaceae bacterium BAC15a-03b]|uniref:NAD(P)H-binding protein n=1 Tax=Winslowiella arboricola TaxID=2978220 RepID=A0A9J6PPR5_9GAMM|nr:NAD(P)H-binding protein [Winslowiella arboricola]MCU5773384.1 NAD(P)H-binding protein [Winslowiella arboricola]MCU5776708.1 NAD(P)H-binding protein [Winslowiella arboricola]